MHNNKKQIFVCFPSSDSQKLVGALFGAQIGEKSKGSEIIDSSF